MTNKQIEAGKEVLMKYLLPDCLKPQYDGMTAWEISKLVLEAGEKSELEEIGNSAFDNIMGKKEIFEKLDKLTIINKNCEHICSGNCRREGCNCDCGEWHKGKEEDTTGFDMEDQTPVK